MASEIASPASPASTTAAAVSDPLGFMEKLSDIVHLYRPPVAASSITTGAPALVIVCSWMDAQPLHIAKYLAPYRDGLVFPGANPPTLLLIRSNRALVFTRARGAAAVKPAVSVVQGFLPELQQSQSEDQPPRLLVHLFSNGGGIMLNHLYNALAAGGDVYLPRHVTIFDSCPGHFRYNVAVGTMTVGLWRRPLLVRLATLSVVHTLVSAFWLRTKLWTLAIRLSRWPRSGGSNNEPNQIAETVLDDAWIPQNRKNGPNRNEVSRVYLYSIEDQLVSAEDVEEHAAEARAQGFTVTRMVLFPESGHVTHARTDPERYWRAVQEAWSGKTDRRVT
ncbi:duf829 domain containing protein [Grosmannia clavigera kw1407]|uniref:Duf829 domain containing protein n=1 Tax=Grosmannia clavigera (strain kw1407 / UAMH 11150) TaxID=655863 RepID=F0XV44_GROCL|nr:duf829 domain containing protein [Grosmannia clavigera kw1407]EFW98914.1 duf829 domain containing protein [Grosmannia clavigera kw1407]